MAFLRMIAQLAFLALAAGFLVTFLRMAAKKAAKPTESDSKNQGSKEA